MRFLFATILSLWTVIAYTQTETCFENLSNPENRIITQEVNNQTLTREYIIYTPSSYDPNLPTPLLINMHGFGDCANSYAQSIGEFYELNKLADDENFIIAFPQGAYRPEKEDTYWEPGDNLINNIFDNDVYFLDQMINEIGTEFNLDSHNIFACGYSNGGMMAYSLACNRSEIYKGIGIMSGTMLDEDCSLDNSVPIIKFHGIEDEVLPYNGNQWYQSVSEVVNFWLTTNNISEMSLVSTTLNDGKVKLDEYSNPSLQACLNLYTIYEEYDKPGGHVWFSDAIAEQSPNEIMWNFFKAKCNSTSSSKQLNDEEETKIYPNPFGNEIIISSSNTNSIIRIFTLDGREVLKVLKKDQTIKIDLSQLKPLIYYLHIDENVRKLVKI